MKKSKLILLALGLSFLGLGQRPPLKGYPIFCMCEHLSEEKGRELVKEKGRDYLRIYYDLSGNDIKDAFRIAPRFRWHSQLRWQRPAERNCRRSAFRSGAAAPRSATRVHLP